MYFRVTLCTMCRAVAVPLSSGSYVMWQFARDCARRAHDDHNRQICADDQTAATESDAAGAAEEASSTTKPQNAARIIHTADSGPCPIQ